MKVQWGIDPRAIPRHAKEDIRTDETNLWSMMRADRTSSLREDASEIGVVDHLSGRHVLSVFICIAVGLIYAIPHVASLLHLVKAHMHSLVLVVSKTSYHHSCVVQANSIKIHDFVLKHLTELSPFEHARQEVKDIQLREASLTRRELQEWLSSSKKTFQQQSLQIFSCFHLRVIQHVTV